MKIKTILPNIAFAAALFCTCCTSNDATDEWNKDGWKSESYPTTNYQNQNYIKVPYVGGKYVFHSTSSDYIRLTEHLFVVDGTTTYGDSENDINHFSNEWCDAKARGDSLVVVFKSNKALARKARIGITTGDTNETICFYQESPYYEQKGSKPERFVGDWVYDPEGCIGGYYQYGQYRYTFNEDGSYICTYDSYDRNPANATFSMTSGDWLDFCDYMYIKSYDKTSVERWDCETSDDHLYIKFREDGTKIPFIRADKSNQPVKPILSLAIKPSKSILATTLMPGEPYTLECSMRAKGYNFKMDNATLIRRTCLNKQNSTFTSDTIDICQYQKDDYCFSIPMTAPDRNHIVFFTFFYNGTYTTSNFVDKEKGFDYHKSFHSSLDTNFKTRE